jgi:hypothetical protein
MQFKPSNLINLINLKQKQIESHNLKIFHELITKEDLVVIDSMSRLKERVQNEPVSVQQIFQEKQSIFVWKNGICFLSIGKKIELSKIN